ncbi:MAG: hypothetical protein P4N41_16940 [Negativicutes bacterium]|nr:hypothetical protein [Negativicutes bacterium]
MEHDGLAGGCHKPECRKKCVGSVDTRYKIYEKCCLVHVIVCPHCGHEYHFDRPHCPACGQHAHEPPRLTGAGLGQGLGYLAGAAYPEYYPGHYLYPCFYSYFGYPYPYYQYPCYPI